MKNNIRIFALIAVFLTGIQSSSAATLIYDFITHHPSENLSINAGYKEVEGSYAYWTGTYAGLFGRKIAFDKDTHVILHGNGGLVDFHNNSKMYVMNVSVGDKITVSYSGDNPKVSFHTAGGARLIGKEKYDTLDSDTEYTVSQAGNLCLMTHWVANTDNTFINRITIKTVYDTETVDVTKSVCTYCSSVPLDFSKSTYLKAYVATDYANGKFTFKQVNYVPSDTGIIILSAGASPSAAKVTIGRSADYTENIVTTNLLVGVLKSERIYMDGNYIYYWIGRSKGRIKAYKIQGDSFYVTGGMAYLKASR